MSLFERTIANIKSNNTKVAQGDHLFIDLEEYFPRLAEIVPGILKDDNIIITGVSGIGKSRFARYLFVEIPVALAKKSSIKPKIFYNSLEESPEKFASTFILRYLNITYGINMSYRELNYPKTQKPHSDDILRKIEEGEEYYKSIEKHVEIISLSNPKAAYYRVIEYLDEVGQFYFIRKKSDGSIAYKEARDKDSNWNHYEYNNSNEFVFLISDNINNYRAIAGKNWYDSIKYFSATLCRKRLNLICNVITVAIHQQASSKETVENSFGKIKLEHKLAPSTDALGDIKITQRDATVILGLFFPGKYPAIEEYAGWEMKRIGSWLRSIHVLKNREGITNKVICTGVDWNTDTFKELPDLKAAGISGSAERERIYNYYNG